MCQYEPVHFTPLSHIDRAKLDLYDRRKGLPVCLTHRAFGHRKLHHDTESFGVHGGHASPPDSFLIVYEHIDTRKASVFIE